MGLTATSRVTNIIIAIMTKRDIHDTTVLEMLNILNLAIQGNAIFDAQHDALTTGTLVFP